MRLANKKKLIIFFSALGIVLLSVLLIAYKFNQIPKNLAIDEVALAYVATSLYGKPYIPFSPLADGHTTLYFYILLFFFKLFGINNFILRLPSAICGVINVLLFYLIMKKAFRRELLPFLLAIIFFTLHWYFNFVRFAFEAPFLLFLELMAIYFFINNSFILSGIFTGLAFNSYQPGLIFFLLLLTFLIIYKKLRKHLLHFLIVFLIIVAPLVLYLSQNKQKDVRIQQELYLIQSNLSFGQKLNYLGQNLVKVSLMFNFQGDLNGRHNYPGKAALNPFLGLLFLAGLGLAIWQRKKFYNQFFLIYFILSLIPTVLTYPWENPSMLRTFTAIPSVVYFIGLSLNKLIPFKKNNYWLILILLLIFLSSVYELRTYFYYQNQVFPHAFIVKRSLMAALENFAKHQYNLMQWTPPVFPK